MKLNWDFLPGMVGVKQKTFCGGSMDIFRNCTLYRHKCFAGKYTIHNIHTKVHPASTQVVYFPCPHKDIGDFISCFFMVICSNSR